MSEKNLKISFQMLTIAVLMSRTLPETNSNTLFQALDAAVEMLSHTFFRNSKMAFQIGITTSLTAFQMVVHMDTSSFQRALRYDEMTSHTFVTKSTIPFHTVRHTVSRMYK